MLNKKNLKQSVIILLLNIFLICGCSVESDVSTSDSCETYFPEIVFSTEGLPPVFQIVIGNTWFNDYYDIQDKLIKADFSSVNPVNSDSFWLISPFYEPREFFFKDFDLSVPIKLSDLAEEMVYQPINLKSTASGYQAGPFISYSNGNWDNLYDWVAEEVLCLYSPPRSTGLINLNPEKQISRELLPFLNRDCLSLSPDTGRVAYIDKGFLVVENFTAGTKNKWPLTKNPEADNYLTFSTEMLTWSPDGRYIAGSNYFYYDYYLYKVWVLDLLTGKLTGFNTRNTHAFLHPSWSPDSRQLVVKEFFKPYSEDFSGQWTLFNIPAKKVIAVNGEKDFSPNSLITWNAQGQPVIKEKPALTVEAFDPELDTLQRNYPVSENPQEKYLATVLRLSGTKDERDRFIDLKPSLKQAGLKLAEIRTLLINHLSSPDGRYIFLQARAEALYDNTVYELYGKLDPADYEVSFLPPACIKPEETPACSGADSLWSGSRVLALSEKGVVKILDLEEMKITGFAVEDPVLAAVWAGENILYSTENGVFLLDRQNNKVHCLLQSGINEKYAGGIKFSPNMEKFSVLKKTAYNETLDSFILEIIDFKIIDNNYIQCT